LSAFLARPKVAGHRHGFLASELFCGDFQTNHEHLAEPPEFLKSVAGFSVSAPSPPVRRKGFLASGFPVFRLLAFGFWLLASGLRPPRQFFLPPA
jgi:hypothetical protein